MRLLSCRKEEKGASQEQFWGNLKSRPHGSRNTGGRRYDKWATNSTRGVQPPCPPALRFSPPGSFESAGFDHKTLKSIWEKLRNPVAALDERIPHISCSWFWMHSQDRTYHILHSDGGWTMTPPQCKHRTVLSPERHLDIFLLKLLLQGWKKYSHPLR